MLGCTVHLALQFHLPLHVPFSLSTILGDDRASDRLRVFDLLCDVCGLLDAAALYWLVGWLVGWLVD
jgi:hypothetical protein